MSNTFDFLSNISLGEDVKTTAARGGGGGVKKERIPTTADLRVFHTGAVYPSADLVKKHDLEYRNKGVEPVGNGYDVFKSTDWALTAKLPKAFLIIGALPKNSGKVDLFDQVRFNNDGNADDKNAGATPMTSVLEQGSPTFGKELLKWLEEIYGVTPNEEGFVDLVIVEAHPLKTSNDVYNIPKLIARGEKAGELSYQRRENMTYFPLTVVEGHVSAPKKEEAAVTAPATEPAAEVTTGPELPFGGVGEETASVPAADGGNEEVPATADVDAPTMGDIWPTEVNEAEESIAPEDEATDEALEL